MSDEHADPENIAPELMQRFEERARRPKPGDRLRRHADDLRSGRLTWVSTAPSSARGEACLVADPRSYTDRERFSIRNTDLAYLAIEEVVGWRGSSALLSDWNDQQTSVEPVVAALEALLDTGWAP